MQSLSNKAITVTNNKMSFTEKLYLPLLQGLWITLKHFFRKKSTINYPEEQRVFADVYRGMHVLKRDTEGRERCTACGLCALSCPAEAITMIAAERTENELHLYREEKYAAVYEINMLRCIFCGFCEEACPKQAIYLTDKIVKANYNRNNFIFGKNMLVEQTDNRINISRRLSKKVIEYNTLQNNN